MRWRDPLSVNPQQYLDTMAADRVNDELRRVVRQLRPTDAPPIRVCEATMADWNAYVESENQIVDAPLLEFFEDERAIYLIERPDCPEHEPLVFAFNRSVTDNPIVRNTIAVRGASSSSVDRVYLPDLSYGPRPSTPGAQRPNDVADMIGFVTVKIEIGVFQDWGQAEGQLDWKAGIWLTTPGVEYALCIKTNVGLTAAEFKLYEVPPDRRRRLIVQPHATPVVPGTVVEFDAHRVLGIPPGRPLPPGFPDPWTVDLHDVLGAARLSVT